MKTRIHAESLLRIPLVRQMLADRQSKLVARAVDARWHYEGILPRLGGFNPLEGAVYYPAQSFFARWLRDRTGSARKYNQRDFLVKEVLFAVHDYLHAWAYRAIAALSAEDLFAPERVTRDALEAMVFAHLVSEAAATIGLDYWFLCTVSLNELCDIGSQMDCGLTTDYHERFAREYRRYDPALNVQAPEFFARFTRFYCSGVLPGFDAHALRESPLVLRWLEHELHYSRLQRRYSRQWFAHLTGAVLASDLAALDGPVPSDAPWQRRLVAQVGAMLWDKVKNDALHELPALSHSLARERSRARPIDFRFTNLNALSSSAPRRAQTSTDPESERYLAYQTIARVDFGRCERRLKMELLSLTGDTSPATIAQRLKRSPKLRRRPDEPRHIFLLA